ncbi:hypothetical protein RYH80_08055 [Halobaculum sp. MBLA0147]|uniref:DUF7718 family protein n=1 Tax=Halobaculum sp. MBLA0147 TaxID=3079934 RepID=UPI0035243E08
MAVRRDPQGEPNPDDFAVNLYVRPGSGENVDIARIDTAHGFTHVDRYYLPEGHDRRKHDEIAIETPEQAVVYVTDGDRWQVWLERYVDNHGAPE